MDSQIFVDPSVSRTKFDREIATWRKLSVEHGKRGIFLIDAEFPDVFVGFAAPHLRPPSVVFGVALNFDNYDLWPPSVRFRDPFTRQPYTKENLPLFLPRPVMPEGADAAPGMQIQVQIPPAVMFRDGRGDAFFCAEGVREYHDHPAHSGNPWLMHRGRGKGTLFHILDKLHEFGIAILKGHNFGILIQSNGYQVGF